MSRFEDSGQDPFLGVPDIDERLADWVDGTMSARDRERFEAELRVSPRLREQLAEYERTVQTIRAAFAAPTGTIDIGDRVIAALAQEACGVGPRKRSVWPKVWAVMSAAALLGIAILIDQWGGRLPAAVTHDDAAVDSFAPPLRAKTEELEADDFYLGKAGANSEREAVQDAAKMEATEVAAGGVAAESGVPEGQQVAPDAGAAWQVPGEAKPEPDVPVAVGGGGARQSKADEPTVSAKKKSLDPEAAKDRLRAGADGDRQLRGGASQPVVPPGEVSAPAATGDRSGPPPGGPSTGGPSSSVPAGPGVSRATTNGPAGPAGVSGPSGGRSSANGGVNARRGGPGTPGSRAVVPGSEGVPTPPPTTSAVPRSNAADGNKAATESRAGNEVAGKPQVQRYLLRLADAEADAESNAADKLAVDRGAPGSATAEQLPLVTIAGLWVRPMAMPSPRPLPQGSLDAASLQAFFLAQMQPSSAWLLAGGAGGAAGAGAASSSQADGASTVSLPPESLAFEPQQVLGRMRLLAVGPPTKVQSEELAELHRRQAERENHAVAPSASTAPGKSEAVGAQRLQRDWLVVGPASEVAMLLAELRKFADAADREWRSGEVRVMSVDAATDPGKPTDAKPSKPGEKADESAALGAALSSEPIRRLVIRFLVRR